MNSPLVKDQWQSEETTTRSKHSTMSNQNKEAQILCSEACNGQYQRHVSLEENNKVELNFD